MFPSNKLSLSGFLNGISNALNIANKAIPVYNEVKPIIKNIYSFKNKISSLNINNIFQKERKKEEKKEEKLVSEANYSSPQFFQ